MSTTHCEEGWADLFQAGLMNTSEWQTKVSMSVEPHDVAELVNKLADGYTE